MAMDYTQTSSGTTEERLARIEAQNEVIIKALQKKKKNIVFVSSSLSFIYHFLCHHFIWLGWYSQNNLCKVFNTLTCG